MDLIQAIMLNVTLTLGQLGLSSAGLAENGRTRSTLDNSRGVREHGGDLETTGALQNGKSMRDVSRPWSSHKYPST
jgi:hypothetical protein